MTAPYDWCDPGCPNPCTCEETIRMGQADEALDKLRRIARHEKGVSIAPWEAASFLAASEGNQP